jgi:hypothetical protein
MPGPVQMGPNAVQNPAALLSALKSQQPPPNPSTPTERVNPDQQALEHVKAAQVSLERAKAYTNDPHMLMVFDVIAGTLTKALLKFDGAAVLQALQQSVSSVGAPAPGMGGPPLGGPPQQQPMVGGGLQGQPPLGLQAAPALPPPIPGAAA